MTNQQNQQIDILYDKECPMCRGFACAIDNHDNIHIVDARKESTLLKEAEQRGFNVDDGSLAYYKGEFFYGYQAMHLIANHTPKKGFVGLMNRIFFKQKWIARISYPMFVGMRKMLLIMLGKPLINAPSKNTEIQKNVTEVYYNSACPVCKAGINHQMEKMDNCNIRWSDVHTSNDYQEALNSELDFIRQRLHIKNEAGEIKVGIDAFIAIWATSPGEAWKAKLLNLPIVHWLAAKSYNGFAWALYHINKLLKHF